MPFCSGSLSIGLSIYNKRVSARLIITKDLSLSQSRNKYMYVLVASNYFTLWTEYYVIPNQEAIKIASNLVNKMFLHFPSRPV